VSSTRRTNRYGCRAGNSDSAGSGDSAVVLRGAAYTRADSSCGGGHVVSRLGRRARDAPELIARPDLLHERGPDRAAGEYGMTAA
jgi:hypothetical protein